MVRPVCPLTVWRKQLLQLFLQWTPKEYHRGYRVLQPTEGNVSKPREGGTGSVLQHKTAEHAGYADQVSTAAIQSVSGLLKELY